MSSAAAPAQSPHGSSTDLHVELPPGVNLSASHLEPETAEAVRRAEQGFPQLAADTSKRTGSDRNP